MQIAVNSLAAFSAFVHVLQLQRFCMRFVSCFLFLSPYFYCIFLLFVISSFDDGWFGTTMPKKEFYQTLFSPLIRVEMLLFSIVRVFVRFDSRFYHGKEESKCAFSLFKSAYQTSLFLFYLNLTAHFRSHYSASPPYLTLKRDLKTLMLFFAFFFGLTLVLFFFFFVF